MYRPKKYIRLNQLPRMPRLSDVKNLHEEGKKARSCTVELPWRTEKLGMTFSLTVRVDTGNSEPIWTLYEGEGNRSRVMWSTGFADVDLLYDVLTLSLPADGPNIFAPRTEEPRAKPAVRSEPDPAVYDREKYRAQVQEADAGFTRSPFLSDEDQFMKPVPFESYAKGESTTAKSDEFKITPSESDASAVSAKELFEAASPAVADSPTEKSGNIDKSEFKTPERPAEKVDRAPAPTADFVNPLAEPQIALGAHHQAAAPAYPDPLQTGQYQQPLPPYPAPPGYPPQPGYPPYPQQQGYPAPPGYPPYPGQPGYPVPPQGYPPQPGYPQHPGAGVSGQYPSVYPPQPGYPGVGVSGQYPPALPYPPVPPMMTNKKPAVMLGTLLVEAGLVPKSTIDSGLQVQVLVSQGTLSPVKAAEAVRRAHLRGGGLDPEEDKSPIRPNDSVVRIKPQLGQVLVMAGIITAVQLKAALHLQEAMRTGNMAMDEAVELLKREANPSQVKSQSAEQIKASPVEDFSKAIALAKQAGLIAEADLEAANKVKEKHGGEISKILVVAGKLDQLTIDAAQSCQKLVDGGKLRVDQAIMGLHYCQRMRVPFEEAARELGFDL
ncbi:MAG: hypothetical protein JSS83_10455 [Cyanobacteria bacterium SZAS LIN-3]|nr:hypothetical protein [Cyanobacteria bacterium SZAS LIN-3]